MMPKICWPTCLRKIDLTVLEDNDRALALNKKFAFQEEGKVTRLVVIGNSFYDGIIMGLLLD